jgi:hypothetical protein
VTTTRRTGRPVSSEASGRDALHVDRLRGRQGGGDAVEAALGQGDRRGLGQVGVRGPGDRAVLGHGQLTGRQGAGGAEQEVDRGGVEAVAQRGEGHPAVAQERLGGRVVGHRGERRGRVGAHVAGVEDPPGAGRHRGPDRRAVLAHRRLPGRPGRHEEDLRGPLERRGEARGVGEVAPPHPHAALLEVARLRGVAHAHAHLRGGDAGEQLLHDEAAERAGGPGDDDQSDSRDRRTFFR